MEYLLSARLFTLASFGELVGTREEVIHCFCKVYFSKLHTCLERHNDRLSSKHFMDHVLQLFKTAGVLLLFANQSKTYRYDKPSCKTKPGWFPLKHSRPYDSCGYSRGCKYDFDFFTRAHFCFALPRAKCFSIRQ